MTRSPDRLYELLPAIHRMRDEELGHPLRTLLRVIGEQVDVVEDDIRRLYDNWFIETCEDWAVPYIGDLIGYRPGAEAGLPGDPRIPREHARNRVMISRREVAQTIAYRRRKGTLALLEELAFSVAGWSARAVEFYRLLAWTQHLNHQRLDRGRTVDLRNADVLARLGSAFDEIAHTVDVRRINSHRSEGRFNIPSVGLFVWRLKSYSVTKAPANCLEEHHAHCFTFSVLGNDAPLYTKPLAEPEPTHVAEEINVPAPVRLAAFQECVVDRSGQTVRQASADYYGEGKSLVVWTKDWPPTEHSDPMPTHDWRPIPRELVIPANLDGWHYEAPEGRVLVDPQNGRLAFPPGQVPARGVLVSYHYGFSADMGGGEYERRIPEVAIDAISRFHSGDIKNWASFLGKLTKVPDTTQDPVSSYVAAQLSSGTQALLTQYQPGSVPSPELQNAIRADLNLLLSDEAFYVSERFIAVSPKVEEDPDVAALLRLEPRSPHVVRLNRRLLELVYAVEIVRSFAFYSIDGGEGDDESDVQEPLREVLKQWAKEKPRHGIIEIHDSGVYLAHVNLNLELGQSLHIRAANGTRPVIRLLDMRTNRSDSLRVKGSTGSRLILDGLLVVGRGLHIEGVRVQDRDAQQVSDGDLCEVVIRHSTLVPGWGLHCDCEPQKSSEPSIELVRSRAHVLIDRSIVGSIDVTGDEVRTEPLALEIRDSIVDATDTALTAVGDPHCTYAHVDLSIVRSTVIGLVCVHSMVLAENTIFASSVNVARRQRGCVRFCYVPPGSRTPRRYECQPDLVEIPIRKTFAAGTSEDEQELKLAPERLRVRPQFNSTRYGTPIYCQLAQSCDVEITHGADDESEMGVFHDLYQPQREANLRARLDEYVPAGTDVGIILVS